MFAPFHFPTGKIQRLSPLLHFTVRASRSVGPKVINHRGRTRPDRGTPERKKGPHDATPLRTSRDGAAQACAGSCAPSLPYFWGDPVRAELPAVFAVSPKPWVNPFGGGASANPRWIAGSGKRMDLRRRPQQVHWALFQRVRTAPPTTPSRYLRTGTRSRASSR
jgi:hypothetical protein